MSVLMLPAPKIPTPRDRNEAGKFVKVGTVTGRRIGSVMPLPPKKIIPALPSDVQLHAYASPPKPMLRADDCYDLPDGSGIYFVWENEQIVYVGKSVHLCRRCYFKSHDSIRNTDQLSWIEYPAAELFFAECYYIGALRPARNRGHGPKLEVP